MKTPLSSPPDFSQMRRTNTVSQPATQPSILTERKTIYSDYLEREVLIDIYLPTVPVAAEDVALLLINDGQDLVRMNFGDILDSLVSSETIEPIMCVGIHCGIDRMNEYGTICQPDYRGRGAKAGRYVKFVFDELIPFIRNEYHIGEFKEKSFAGFSLGGLSAMDIVWNHPYDFSKVGVFSGSLWWRRKGYDNPGYNWERDRIMHMQVEKGSYHPWLKFFFECGQFDESADRNNNGVIDSIDDTLELIEMLQGIGYESDDIFFLELEDGRHDVPTWAKAFPDFLKWGWGKY